MPNIVPNYRVDGYYIIPSHARSLDECVFTPCTTSISIEKCYEEIGTDMIQLVRLENGGSSQGIIDEDGKIKGKPLNAIATVLYANPHDAIVGTMVIACGKAKLR